MVTAPEKTLLPPSFPSAKVPFMVVVPLRVVVPVLLLVIVIEALMITTPSEIAAAPARVWLFVENVFTPVPASEQVPSLVMPPLNS